MNTEKTVRMKEASALILACLLIGGCATPQSRPTPPELPVNALPNLEPKMAEPPPPARSRPLEFPARGATTLITPDNRTWKATYAKAEDDDRYQLDFEQADRKPDAPLEKLCFTITDARYSKSQLTRAMNGVQTGFDPLHVYSFAGDDGSFTLTYSSPKYKEYSVWRVVRHGTRYAAVAYRDRLGASGAAAREYWTRIISELPDSYFVSALLDSDLAQTLGGTSFGGSFVRFQPHEGDHSRTSIEVLTQVDQPPVIRSYPSADFKYPAVRCGDAIQVALQLQIGEDGTVTDAFILRTDMPDANDAFIAAFKRAKFRPALTNGKPTSCSVRLQLDLVL